jgi:ribosomal protein L40E
LTDPRKMIESCIDFWDRDHWLKCQKCTPWRKLLKANLYGFATFEDWQSDWDTTFKICDDCNETMLSAHDLCVRCHSTNLRKENRIINE